MLMAAAALLAGLWAGLIRIGWPLPPLLPRLPADHGPLMVSGFLGTLIALERAVALAQIRRQRLYYLAPLLAGLGAIAFFLPVPMVIPKGLGVLGALGMLIIFAVIIRMQTTTDHVVMGAGALFWLIGNSLWLAGRPLFQVVPWWTGFLVLTIAGERLELSRVLMLTRTARLSFLGIIGLFVVGLLLSLGAADGGIRLAGVALIGLGLWLFRFDIARRTVRKWGLTRYIAACLLPGYFWLIAGGLLWAVYGAQYAAGPIYDALLHTIFLGFVFSMIFGHAPIIVPAIVGLQIPYTPIFYVHLALLHLSLILRVSGDLLFLPGIRRWGGLLNEVAILLFLLVTVIVIRRGRQRDSAPSHP